MDFVSANSDFGSFEAITLSGDFTVGFWIDLTIAGNQRFGLAETSTSANFFGTNTSQQRIYWRTGAGSLYISSVNYPLKYAFVCFVREGTTTTVYIDGEEHYTTTTDTNNCVLNGVALVDGTFYRDQTQGATYIQNSALTASQISQLYNNPNDIVRLGRQFGADRIYVPKPNNGFGTGYSNVVLDYSGNNKHMTLNTSAAGSPYVMSVVTSESLQLATHSKSFYSVESGTGTVSGAGTTITGSGTSFTTELAVNDILVVNGETRKITAIASNTSLTVASAFGTALSADSFEYYDQDQGGTFEIPVLTTDGPEGVTDLFGNTASRPWRRGIFDFFGINHEGGQIGTTTDVFDGSEISIFVVFQNTNTSVFRHLFGNRDVLSGIAVYIDNNDKFSCFEVNENLTYNIIGTTTLTENTWYKGLVTLSSDGKLNLYLAEYESQLTSDATEVNAVNGLGNGSIIPRIATRSNNTLQFKNRVGVYVTSKVLTEEQRNQLSDYADTIIRKFQ